MHSAALWVADLTSRYLKRVALHTPASGGRSIPPRSLVN
jgi:hypothetical protein